MSLLLLSGSDAVCNYRELQPLSAHVRCEEEPALRCQIFPGALLSIEV